MSLLDIFHISELKEELNSYKNKYWELNNELTELSNELTKKNDQFNMSSEEMESYKKENVKLNEELYQRDKRIISILQEVKSIKIANRELSKQLNKYRDLEAKRSYALDNIFESNLKAYPYIASVFADYKTIDLDIMVKQLSWGDNIARKKKVASLTDIKQETKALLEQYKIAEYQLGYLKTIFPAIEDFLETDFRNTDYNMNLTDFDPVRNYISREEYNSLSSTERNQLALDRYIESTQKNSWQIGRDYELYVGYKYSLAGYTIDYFGSYMGLEDLGRDLIAKRGWETLIIQCKYWSKKKTIHEKHIAQLYGTYISYCIETNCSTKNVHPVFITSTILSDKAKEFCQYLGISYKENYALGNFPRIKCNIGRDEFGLSSYIYHLPMDQQYDKVKICKKGEFFAFTVKEAEEHGFRRAYKWHSN